MVTWLRPLLQSLPLLERPRRVVGAADAGKRLGCGEANRVTTTRARCGEGAPGCFRDLCDHFGLDFATAGEPQP